MPFHTKIQPIDSDDVSEVEIPFPENMKQMPKSRLKRLFERQFSVKNASEAAAPPLSRGGSGDFEPSSVCLAKMVVNFMEDNNNGEKHGRGSRCSCFSGSGTESSDDESDWSDDSKAASSREGRVTLKSLVLCTSIHEMRLVDEVTKIVETSKDCKRKDESFLKIVVDELVRLGYDAALCKSRWEKSSSYPAGEYEYVDVMIDGERLLIDIDFKSNFEIARATKTYKSILQTLPCIFVGKAERLQRIIILICEAAKKSLKKKGLHVPPWRRAEYVKSKWMSPYVRGPDAGEDKQEPVDVLTKSVGSIDFGV
ncbi:DNA-directed RNA polymerase subunit beta-beta protein [Hirschfeldia incana]|nr:DNA-directed RNA polymerase subunit beta-beta protein [Hirschfeldia incana]